MLRFCRLPALVLLAALTCAAFWPGHASAQVKRCAGPHGETIYTDRNCQDIGATDRLVRPNGEGYAPPAYRGGCPRRLSDLVHGLSTAIDARDVNRLALYYDWGGMSTRNAYALMAKLDGIVQRPLVDILPVYARPPPILASDGSVIDANADGYFPQTTVRRRPTGLRLEQTFGDGITPSRTFFGLRKRLDCWLVVL